MLVQSVRALAPHWDLHVALGRDGPLVGACREAGARTEVLALPMLHKGMFTVRGLSRFVRDTVRGVLAARRLVHVERPDLVYVNTVTVPAWLLVARSAGIPAICHVHEAEEAVPALVRWMLAVPLRLARSVLANSEAARGVLVRSDRRLAGRIRVVHNGVPGPAADPAPLRDRLDGDVRLLLVGRLAHRKGSDVAVEALRLLGERGIGARLTLAGDAAAGYDGYVEGLRDQVTRAGLTDRVTFGGFVPDVWGLHGAADIVLVPSRWEPFGNVAVEGMLAGRPVISSDAQGLPEIVEDTRSGLVVPAGDAVALAGAVERLVADWPWARRLAATGQVRARSRFGTDRYARQLQEFISDQAAERGQSGMAAERGRTDQAAERGRTGMAAERGRTGTG
jgi:glycosyltransferase involved in cell wall biosynthesis